MNSEIYHKKVRYSDRFPSDVYDYESRDIIDMECIKVNKLYPRDYYCNSDRFDRNVATYNKTAKSFQVHSETRNRR